MPQSPHVAIVVLSWNGRNDTLACLDSLGRLEYEPLSVVVVDNASTDGSADAIAMEHPDVRLVSNAVNRGYAGGMNVGLEAALRLDVEHIVLLNNDVVVDPCFLEPLVNWAVHHPEACAVCPVVFYRDEPELVWFAGGRFDPTRGYNGRLIGHGERLSQVLASVHESDWACGAAMLVPRRALEAVGMFDESLFAYVEDLEWSLRARSRGYCITVVPDSRVWHSVSASTGGESSPTALYYDVRNMLVVMERHATLGAMGTWRRRIVTVGAHVVQAVVSCREPVEGVRSVWRGFRDFSSGRLGARNDA